MAHQASHVRASSESNRLALTRIVRALGLVLLMTQAVVAQSAPQSVPTWRDPSPHQVRWITVDSSVRLEVLDWGGSGRPMVWLGCYLSAHVHDEIAPKLTNQFHVYGVTRRGIGASDKPATGYTVQRSVNDVLEVLDALNLQKSLLVGTSCAGQILTMFAGQHSDRLYGLVYLDGATDPTLSPAEYDPPMPDPTTLPRSIKSAPAPDITSFEAFRIAQRRDQKVAFPEAELRQQFVANPDGSVGRSLLSPEIRRAITVDARVKPNYAGIRVPVLAIYQADRPFEEVAADFDIHNEQERAALRQQYAATRAMYMRWQHDLLAAVPTARIVELPDASLFMFLSNQADVLREIRAFAATLTSR
jgi:non-heme chloroperoxidase